MTVRKQLSRKRWYRLIPVIFITYSFAYLDRANFGFAAAGGMEKDLHITSGMVSFLGSLFFPGLFYISGSRSPLRGKKKCEKAYLLVTHSLGRARGSNRSGEQYKSFDCYQIPAGCG